MPTRLLTVFRPFCKSSESSGQPLTSVLALCCSPCRATLQHAGVSSAWSLHFQVTQRKSNSEGKVSRRSKLPTYKGVRQEKMFSSTAMDILKLFQGCKNLREYEDLSITCSTTCRKKTKLKASLCSHTQHVQIQVGLEELANVAHGPEILVHIPCNERNVETVPCQYVCMCAVPYGPYEQKI